MRTPIRGLSRALLLIAASSHAGHAGLPPVPVPAENPVTEAKRVLGKILFWDEQLSSDDTVACGTCHRPASGGADPRSGRHPGTDKGTIDDVYGSPGIASLNRDGEPRRHPVFGNAPQITPRLAPSVLGALWADAVFWDGRAGPTLADPLTGKIAVAAGGALENQVLMTLVNDAEMAKADRSWADLTQKLARVDPLALASDLNVDVVAAIREHGDYPALFAWAFGDGAITPVRIAFAIASYERTLVPDETPWDRYEAGDERAMAQTEIDGWRAFQSFHCASCHEPPLFTNNRFMNIGLRRAELDRGRENVTGDPEDTGEMKVPSLRNAGLRARFMHTGEFANLGAAVGFYVNAPPLPERDEIPGIGIYAFNLSSIDRAILRAFLANALTDPRVQSETSPFDRPTLRSEREPGHAARP